ncbi:MAG TPA: hypothetical protein VN457_01680 [Chlamydiales bacterium]|nr:hypothetical protein [Chlamydiales bacterium]
MSFELPSLNITEKNDNIQIASKNSETEAIDSVQQFFKDRKDIAGTSKTALNTYLTQFEITVEKRIERTWGQLFGWIGKIAVACSKLFGNLATIDSMKKQLATLETRVQQAAVAPLAQLGAKPDQPIHRPPPPVTYPSPGEHDVHIRPHTIIDATKPPHIIHGPEPVTIDEEVDGGSHRVTTPEPPSMPQTPRQKIPDASQVQQQLQSQTNATFDTFLENLQAQVGNNQPPSIVGNALLRFDQLSQLEFEDTADKAPLMELFKMALFIEDKIVKTQNVAKGILYPQDPTKAGKDTNLAREIQVDPAKGYVYLMAHHTFTAVDANDDKVVRGAQKQLAKVAALPLQSLAKTAGAVMAQLFLYDPEDRAKTVETAKRELEITAELQGEGIIELQDWTDWTDTISGVAMPNVSMVFKKYDGNLLDCEKLTLQEQQLVARKCLKGLSRIHEKGYIHGDIKGENILIKRERIIDPITGKVSLGKIIDAVLIDFGSTFKTPQRGGTYTSASNYGDRSYGSPQQTPPEMVGVPNFKGDHHAADVWALGFALYQASSGVNPNWAESIETYPTSLHAQARVKKEATALRTELTHEPTKEPVIIHTPENEGMRTLLANMLHPDPTKRIATQEALALIE